MVHPSPVVWAVAAVRIVGATASIARVRTTATTSLDAVVVDGTAINNAAVVIPTTAASTWVATRAALT